MHNINEEPSAVCISMLKPRDIEVVRGASEWRGDGNECEECEVFCTFKIRLCGVCTQPKAPQRVVDSESFVM